MRALFVFALIAACVVHHRVQLLLGPRADQPTKGFACGDPMAPGSSMFARAVTPTRRLQFSLAIDMIELPGHVPSCLGEEIKATCENGECPYDLANRSCIHVDVQLPPAANDTAQIVKLVDDWLKQNAPVVFGNAPDGAVIVRAIAIDGPTCDEVLTSTNILGCAYSCPVVLDQIDGVLSLGLAVQDNLQDPATCVAAIDACAMFPN
jgi:hypothetical protein